MSIDFSDILPEPPYAYTFNPSVAHWKEDLYLCVYRVFTRNFPAENAYRKNLLNPMQDPNHPWLSTPKSCWWNPRCLPLEDPGYDITKLIILKIRDGVINVVKGDYFENNSFPGVDARILALGENKFIISYNSITLANKAGKVGIYTNIVEILSRSRDEKIEFNLYSTTQLCDEISQKIEKNWSFWTFPEGDKRQLYFSYNLAPTHEVFKASIEPEFLGAAVKCIPERMTSLKSYFGFLESCYNHAGSFETHNKFFYISVTTPALPFRKSNNLQTYIGVGHLKIKWRERKNFPPESPLYVFYNTIAAKYKHHPVYDYFMFIYEFDPVTFDILRITDFFIPNVPEKTGYLLAFPSGLCFDALNSDNVMIFYGDHDSYCKMISFTTKQVDDMLKNDVSSGLENLINGCTLIPGPDFLILV